MLLPNGSTVKKYRAVGVAIVALLSLVCSVTPAFAHFAWLVLAEDGKSVQIYFSEDATSNDEDLVDYIAQSKLWHVAGDQAEPLETKLEEKVVKAALAQDKPVELVVLSHDLGVMERGGSAFVLKYYAKTGPALGADVWKNTAARKVIGLDIVPSQVEGRVRLELVYQDKPVKDAEVVIVGPGLDTLELKSDEQGIVEFKPADGGLYSIRARHIEPVAGELDGKKYDSIRHYSTLALQIGEASAKPATTSAKPAATSAHLVESHNYPDLPLAITSFGAAIVGDQLFAYGGHTGEAHSYSDEEQSNQLFQLDLAHPTEWKSNAEGPRLQGLAMVAVGDKLYRMGGFTAKNVAGAKHDLWSQNGVATFDVKSRRWQDAPDLPEPRSSFDAAVAGNMIYVVGGWQLRGAEDSVWHKTAWKLDPAAEKPQWEALPEPPFQRRALALAEYQGKLYALGGMDSSNKPSTKVDIYDIKTGAWSEGPNLPGQPMEGFGCSAFAVDGKLYVSTMSGKLLQLSADGNEWEEAMQLKNARFFHRMLPIHQHELVLLGGANMGTGKFLNLDVVEVKP